MTDLNATGIADPKKPEAVDSSITGDGIPPLVSRFHRVADEMTNLHKDAATSMKPSNPAVIPVLPSGGPSVATSIDKENVSPGTTPILSGKDGKYDASVGSSVSSGSRSPSAPT